MDPWSVLTKARTDMAPAPHYDETLHEVTERVEASGSIGKLDIAALTFWKRVRANATWVADLLNTPETAVRAITAHTVEAARDRTVNTPEAARTARRSLCALPGFGTGDAIASALIVAAAPDRMAIYDRRASKALTLLGKPLSNKPGRYARYLEHVEELRATGRERGDDWSARDVDLALWWIGGNEELASNMR